MIDPGLIAKLSGPLVDRFLGLGEPRTAKVRIRTDVAVPMADGAELRVHPTGKATVRLSVKTQGQGHETTFAQIVAGGFAPETVRRVIRLVDLSEYKRRQGAPGIKITPRAFGRDRRMPITNLYRERM